MISVEQWRARIGLFGTKRYSGCRSSLLSSYVPFTFRRGRRERSTSAQQEPPTEEPPSQRASQPQVNVPGNLNTNPFPPAEKQSVVSLKDEKSSSLSSHVSRCFNSFLYTGLLKSSPLREALIRSVLLMVIISQLLITSGDVEENPGPDPSDPPTMPDLTTLVAKRIPTKWYEVGIQLKIEKATLDAFEQQNKDQMRLYCDVFDEWKKEEKLPYTWDTIMKALEKVGEIETVKDIRKWLANDSSLPASLPGDAVQHGPVTLLVKPGVSKELLSLLAEYASMIKVLRAVKLSDENFLTLKNFLSDLCDEVSIQQCSTISDMINLLKNQLMIYLFNIDALNVSCKHFCSSAVTDSVQQYEQHLKNFFSHAQVKDLVDSLETELPENSEVETVTLKLDASWIGYTLKAMKRLVYHLVGNYSKALVLHKTHRGCVCVTWIVPTSIVPNLRAIVKAKQFLPEYKMYLARKGVIELVIGMRIAPNEALLSGQSSLSDLSQNASDLDTKLGSEEQHDMMKMMMRVRDRMISDLEGSKKKLEGENLEYRNKCKELEEKCEELKKDFEMLGQKASDLDTKLGSEKLRKTRRVRDLKISDLEDSKEKPEDELRPMDKEKLDYPKKCKELEEKCKELENDVEMLEQKAAIRNPAVSEAGVQVTSDEKETRRQFETTQLEEELAKQLGEKKAKLEEKEAKLEEKEVKLEEKEAKLEEKEAKLEEILLKQNEQPKTKVSETIMDVSQEWKILRKKLSDALKKFSAIAEEPKDSNSKSANRICKELKRPLLLIPVTGSKKSGKTYLVNAMLGGSVVHRGMAFPIYVEHVPDLHLHCESTEPCDFCVRLVTSTGIELAKGRRNVLFKQEQLKMPPIDEYYIIQTKIPMLENVTNDFPFTVYLADCPGDKIARLTEDFELSAVLVPAVVCAVSTSDYKDKPSETLESTEQALTVTYMVNHGRAEAHVVFAATFCDKVMYSGDAQAGSEESLRRMKEDLVKCTKNSSTFYAVADKWARKTRNFIHDPGNKELLEYVQAAWQWVQSQEKVPNWHNPDKIVELAIGRFENCIKQSFTKNYLKNWVKHLYSQANLMLDEEATLDHAPILEQQVSQPSIEAV